MAVIVSAAALAAGCQSKAERLHADRLFLAQRVHEILKRTNGRLEASLEGLKDYHDKNRDRLSEYLERRSSTLAAMSGPERERFLEEDRDKASLLESRIEDLVRSSSDPPRLMIEVKRILPFCCAK